MNKLFSLAVLLVLPVSATAENIQGVDYENDHIYGNVNAPITLIEYGDYECPFCAKIHPVMKQLVEKYNGQVNWVFRQFPLAFHSNARIAARAAECAALLEGNEGFQRYSDYLFEQAGGKGKEKLLSYAETLGFDTERFNTCLTNKETDATVEKHYQSGRAYGVSGTPGTIILNHQTGEWSRRAGAMPFETFTTILDPIVAGVQAEGAEEVEAEERTFSDLHKETRVGKAARALVKRGIIRGYDDGSFRPRNPVNRAEAAKILLLAKLGEIDSREEGEDRFPDVPRGAWFRVYVAKAATFGIIKGHPDGQFRPADTVNTAEFLKMLTKAFDLETGYDYGYTDVPEDAWFAQYAGLAEHYELFPERPEDMLQPGSLLTRGEVVYAVQQVLEDVDE